jgi:hypothetical protein
MELMRVEQGEAHVRVAPQELLILNNALNEVCNGIDVPEFETRMGVALAQVRSLLSSVQLVIDELDAPKT